MNFSHSEETLSAWHASTGKQSHPTLKTNLLTDVCVIGGGIAGLTTAYLLLQQGLRVCLLERSLLAHGQSGRSTAHLTAVLDKRYYDLETQHGTDNTILAARSHLEALNQIEKIIRSEKIKCGLKRVTGYLFADSESQLPLLQKEYYAARRAGLPVYLAERAPLNDFHTGPALAFPKQMQIDPVRYLLALADRITAMGGEIYTNSHVNKVEDGSPARVAVAGGFEVLARHVVVATHTPINDLFALHTKQAPYRSYVLGFKIPAGSVTAAVYWDTADPYHFVRTAETGEPEDLLIVGGEDHKTGQDDHPEHRFDALEYWARLRFPQATKIAFRWSGQIMESTDGLAFLGRNPGNENIYVITGDSGNGLTNCTIGAGVIRDLIGGRENPYARLYEPGRVSMKSAGTFLQENTNVVAQYRDWFSTRTRPDFSLLPAGTGTVYREGLRMVAAYKDDSGQVCTLSAACPHLGGVVHWNPVEKSWDCPCHGSRFAGNGEVLEGPAHANLKKINDSAETRKEEQKDRPTPRTPGPNI